jgi:hypothetical protein
MHHLEHHIQDEEVRMLLVVEEVRMLLVVEEVLVVPEQDMLDRSRQREHYLLLQQLVHQHQELLQRPELLRQRLVLEKESDASGMEQLG